MPSEKRKKRDSKKYPALNPRLNSRTKFDKIDYDYLDKLSQADKEWLNRFSGEYYSGDFKKEEGSVRGDGKYLEDNIHTTDAQRRECWTRNNRNNVDYISVAKAKGEAVYPEDIIETIDTNTYSELNDFESLMTDIMSDEKKKQYLEDFKFDLTHLGKKPKI